MKYFFVENNDADYALYEKNGKYYPVFEEKYGSEYVEKPTTLKRIFDEETIRALDKYMNPYADGIGKIYMAGPLFNEGDRYTNQCNSDKLRALGYTTFLPQEVVITNKSSALVKAACFFMDLKAINLCDALVVNCNGIEIDSGTAAEIGLGYGLGKKIVLYKSDVRNYYNETHRVNNFVGGLVDNKVYRTMEEVIAALKG